MPSGPNLRRISAVDMNSTGAPSASPMAPPSRQPRMRFNSPIKVATRSLPVLPRYAVAPRHRTMVASSVGQPAWPSPDLPSTRPPLQGGQPTRRRWTMPPQTLASKVEELQTRVTRLEELPARIDDLTSQVSQLRTEMRDEFSAVQGKVDGLEEKTDRIEAKTDGLSVQMRVLHEDV